MSLEEPEFTSVRQLPAGPLLEVFDFEFRMWQADHRGDTDKGKFHDFCRMHGFWDRTIDRIRRDGIVNQWMADRICCTLGHPTAMVYGTLWTGGQWETRKGQFPKEVLEAIDGLVETGS